MNLKTKLVAPILMIASASMAQAAVVGYDVIAVFDEPQTMTGHTTFTGSFNWDATTETVTGLVGTMNETMYPNMMAGVLPDLSLGFQLATSVVGNIVTASVFKENTTDVFFGGGYTTGSTMKYGATMGMGSNMFGNTPNENAYFTLVFDKTTMMGAVDDIVYGDCAPGGLMGPMMTGDMCMTGHSVANAGALGTMDGSPLSVNISQVSTVPLPAAVWLFGGALMGLIGVNRRKRVLPA